MCLNVSFKDIRHFRNLKALTKTGPLLALFQQNKSKNVKNCQNIDKMVLFSF